MFLVCMFVSRVATWAECEPCHQKTVLTNQSIALHTLWPNATRVCINYIF